MKKRESRLDFFLVKAEGRTFILRRFVPLHRTRAVSLSFRDGRDAPRQTERTGGRGAATARRYVRQRRSDDDGRERRASEVQVRAIRVSGRARISRRSHRTLFRHIRRGASYRSRSPTRPTTERATPA